MALRMAPGALLDCDDEVFERLVELAERERTEALWALEVQAVTAEMVHALWRLTVQVNSKKGARPPAAQYPPALASRQPAPPATGEGGRADRANGAWWPRRSPRA